MNVILQKKIINTFLIQFSTIVYITSKFNFAKENNKYFFLIQCSAIVYVTSKLNFATKKKVKKNFFFYSISNNSLHN